MAALNNAALSQDFISDPKVRVAGPTGQVVVLTIRYFEEQNVVRTDEKRQRISIDDEPTSIEIGFDGFQVLLSSPTSATTKLSLWDGEDLVEETTLREPGVESISFGSAKSATLIPPPSIRLSDAESEFVKRVVESIAAAQTSDLVSRKEFANIDGPTLDAFCAYLNSELGLPLSDTASLDGWLGWQGTMGAKVFSGPLKYKSGTCFFTLMFVEEKLVDVQIDCEHIPDSWFEGPARNEPYIARANAITKLMFFGQIQQARGMFSPRVRDDISDEVLRGINTELKSNFSTVPSKIEFKKAVLGEFNEEAESRILRIVHAIELGTKRCLSSVDFEFLCGPKKIGRGDLVGINFKEAWQSSRPKLAELAERALPLVCEGAPLKTWQTIMSPEASKLLRTEQFDAVSSQVQQMLGRLVAKPDWDLWRANGTERFVFAEGPAEFENGTFNLHFDFADDRLLGYSVVGEFSCSSSMNTIENQDTYAETGAKFWSSVLASRSREAYGLLSDGFQEQLGQSEFNKLIKESGLAQQQPVQVEFLGARISDRLDRPYPAMISAYFMARRGDELLALRTEYEPNVKTDDAWQPRIVDFSSGFETKFPVTDTNEFETLFAALKQTQPEALLQLMPENDRRYANPKVLAAFLNTVSQLLQSHETERPIYAMSFFEGGSYGQKFAAMAKSGEHQIPLLARFKFGQLIGFEILDAEVQTFEKDVDVEAVFRDVAESFVDDWFTMDTALAGWLSANLRTPQTAKRLEKLRETIIGIDGQYRSVETSLFPATMPKVDGNVSPLVEAEVDYTSGKTSLVLEFELTAFGARVQGITTKEAFLKQNVLKAQ